MSANLYPETNLGVRHAAVQEDVALPGGRLLPISFLTDGSFSRSN